MLLTLAGGDPQGITGPHVTHAAKAGDPLAVEFVHELASFENDAGIVVGGRPPV